MRVFGCVRVCWVGCLNPHRVELCAKARAILCACMAMDGYKRAVCESGRVCVRLWMAMDESCARPRAVYSVYVVVCVCVWVVV